MLHLKTLFPWTLWLLEEKNLNFFLFLMFFKISEDLYSCAEMNFSNVPSTQDEEDVHQSLFSPVCNVAVETWRALEKRQAQI